MGFVWVLGNEVGFTQFSQWTWHPLLLFLLHFAALWMLWVTKMIKEGSWAHSYVTVGDLPTVTSSRPWFGVSSCCFVLPGENG